MTWKPDYNVTPQRIVCAANRLQNGFIILGIRNCDETMHITKEALKITDEDWSKAEQGFVDQFSNFLRRKEALLIAVKANQIYRFVGSQTKDSLLQSNISLYSENLY